jgi:L-histidine N-alpha-methyltransferase
MSTPPSAARAESAVGAGTFAEEVATHLRRTPRALPTSGLYDPLGSALFEAICRLPWYRVARTEQRLLEAHAPDIFARLGAVSQVAELGPGSGLKLVTLLSARPRTSSIGVHLIDVSAEALAQATRAVRALPGVWATTHQATYEAGLADMNKVSQAPGRALVVFLGSNIGNFDPAGADALLRAVRGTIRPGDALLLGADLVKPESELLLAYDDPLGVTAAFNKNLLLRVNRELAADFDVTGFTHRALWNASASRVEMHLLSLHRQRVRIPASRLDITLEAGETLWTESSYKYQAETIEQMGTRAGFRLTAQWVEETFALSLFEAS